MTVTSVKNIPENPGIISDMYAGISIIGSSKKFVAKQGYLKVAVKWSAFDDDEQRSLLSHGWNPFPTFKSVEDIQYNHIIFPTG